MTSRGIVFLCLLVLFVGLAPPVSAQRFKWWQDDKVKAELKLTADQSLKIEEIFQASLPKQRTLKETLDRLEVKLSELVGGMATEAEVMKQASIVESTRSELSTARTLMIYRMQRILTPEQRVKFKVRHDQEAARGGQPQGPHKPRP
jgi:Spy/CpxP family protein refolding chaperone